MSRLAAAGLALCLAGGLQAQTMYKCTGADGKSVFSDRPCPSAGTKQEARTAPKPQTLAPPPVGRIESDAETARRWGVNPADFAVWRRSCSLGDQDMCVGLDRMKRTGPDTPEIAQDRARQRKEALNRESALCRGGDPAACERVEKLQRGFK